MIDLFFAHRDNFNLRRGWQSDMLHHHFLAPYNFNALGRVLSGGLHTPYMGAWYWRNGAITVDPRADYDVPPDALRVGYLSHSLTWERARVPYDVSFRAITRYGVESNFASTYGAFGLSRPAATIALRHEDGAFEVILIGLPSPLGQYILTFTSLERDAKGIYHPYGLFRADMQTVERFMAALPVDRS